MIEKDRVWRVCQATVKYRTIKRDQTAEKVTSPDTIAAAVRSMIGDDPREHFFLFCLDTRAHRLAARIVAIGTVNQALVCPREVFRMALEHGTCSRIIVAHNHPSDDATPSAEDDAVTRRLRKAGDLLGVQLLDHVVVARDSFHSYARVGWANADA